MTDIWERLKTESRPVCLYGTGNGADKIIDKMILDGSIDKVKGVFASSDFIRNKKFRGYQIESYEALRERFPEMLVLICFGTKRPEVLANIERIAAEQEVLAPEVPVYGNEIFDKAYYLEHKDELDKVRALLADDLSVKTFDILIENKLSGRIDILKECETTEEEETSLLGDIRGTFLDLGAYNGDTAAKYGMAFPGIDRIIAVEPDIRNFRKLEANTKGLDIRLINSLISDTIGEVAIGGKGGRGISESREGKALTRTDTVDNILAGENVSFIKMDVEGNELKAINGAARTIRNYKPAMHIAAYHKSGDLFEIPLRVFELNNSYKIYLRHTRHIPAWDTDLIFV